eukprot:sb/3473515/
MDFLAIFSAVSESRDIVRGSGGLPLGTLEPLLEEADLRVLAFFKTGILVLPPSADEALLLEGLAELPDLEGLAELALELLALAELRLLTGILEALPVEKDLRRLRFGDALEFLLSTELDRDTDLRSFSPEGVCAMGIPVRLPLEDVLDRG